MVDKVVIYDTQEEMCNYIKSFNIDYMMIGDEYKDKNIFCREFSKNDVVFFPKDNRSSIKIIEKIKKS